MEQIDEVSNDSEIPEISKSESSSFELTFESEQDEDLSSMSS